MIPLLRGPVSLSLWINSRPQKPVLLVAIATGLRRDGRPFQATLAGRVCRAHPAKRFHENLRRMRPMPRVKLASKQKRTTKAAAMRMLGAAGLGLSLVGSASASRVPTADVPQSDNTSPNQRFVLDEEEMADVSLATFHLFDRENVGGDLQMAAVVVGGCRACRGCRVWRGCSWGGCGGCGGCGGGGAAWGAGRGC